MKNEKIINSVLFEDIRAKIAAYLKIPSLSRSEELFIAFLTERLSKVDIQKDYSIALVDQTIRVFCRRGSDTTVFTHADRVKTGIKAGTDIITVSGDLYLESQLDNAVSIAVMMRLIEQNTPLNWVITTREECCTNQYQILNYLLAFPKQSLIDLDIDVTDNAERDIFSGAVSIRNRDNYLPYNQELIGELRAAADKLGIKHVAKDGEWMINQLGMALNTYCATLSLAHATLHRTMRFAYLGIPIWNYHTAKEFAHSGAIVNACRVLEEFAKGRKSEVRRLRTEDGRPMYNGSWKAY